MSDREQKPRKVRRRRTTGRVSGTTQSGFASNSMTGILQQEQSRQADKTEKTPPQKKKPDVSNKDAGNEER